MSLPIFTQEDFDRLYLSLTQKNSSDLTIELSDGEKRLEINVHKSIIILNSIFLAKTLSFGNDCDGKVLKLRPNGAYDINAAYDIILSFYGQQSNIGQYPKWRHLAAIATCRKFWSLNIIEESISKDTIIEAQSYDDFLQYLSTVSFNDKNMEAARRFMPKDYDWNKLTEDFVQQILLNQKYPIVVYKNTIVKNMLDDKIILDFTPHTKAYLIVFSPDGFYIATLCDSKVCIWDTTNRLVYSFDYIISEGCTITSSHCTFTQDSTAITIAHYEHILTHDFVRGIQLNNQVIPKYIHRIAYSLLDRYFVSSHPSTVNLWDYSTKQCVHLAAFPIVETTLMLNFASDNKYLIVGSNNTIKIWSIDTFTPYKPTKKIIKVSLKDTQYAVVLKDYSSVEIWDIINDKLINTFQSFAQLSPDNNYVIAYNFSEFHMRNIIDGTLHKTFTYSDHMIISPNMKYIISIYSDCIFIYKYDVDTLHNKILYREHNKTKYSNVSFFSDRYLKCTNSNNTLDIFDIEKASEAILVCTIDSKEIKLLENLSYTRIGDNLPYFTID